MPSLKNISLLSLFSLVPLFSQSFAMPSLHSRHSLTRRVLNDTCSHPANLQCGAPIPDNYIGDDPAYTYDQALSLINATLQLPGSTINASIILEASQPPFPIYFTKPAARKVVIEVTAVYVKADGQPRAGASGGGKADPGTLTEVAVDGNAEIRTSLSAIAQKALQVVSCCKRGSRDPMFEASVPLGTTGDERAFHVTVRGYEQGEFPVKPAGGYYTGAVITAGRPPREDIPLTGGTDGP